MRLCDIGVNLTNNRFNDDWEATIQRSLDVGVDKLIITGTDMAESKDALLMCDSWLKHCYATVGIHPHYAKDAVDVKGKPNFYQDITQLASHSNAVAIGECGLDFNRNFSPRDIQLAVFEAQLEIACDLGMPVFLHERDAFEEQIRLLEKYRSKLVGGVVHCFTGNTDQIKAYLDLDFYIGITGWLCDAKRGQELREAVTHLPLNRLLLETDAPYLMPKTLKTSSKRNEPENLPHILEQLAAILLQQEEHAALSLQDIAHASYQNSITLFGLEQ